MLLLGRLPDYMSIRTRRRLRRYTGAGPDAGLFQKELTSFYQCLLLQVSFS